MSGISIILKPKPYQRVIMHLSFWLLLFVVRLYLTCISFTVYSGFPFTIVALLTLSNVIMMAAIFYLFTGVGWRLIQQHRWVIFMTLLSAGFCIYTALDTLIEKIILFNCQSCLVTLKNNQPSYYQLLISDTFQILLKRLLTLGVPFNLLLTLSIPVSLKLGLNAWRAHTKALDLEKDKLELELNFLKAQLNPHFLFNSMNNIYGTILKGETDCSANLVARLSGLLRYMLYETNGSYVPLFKEIKLMSDYIELEKIRLNFTTIRTDHHLMKTDQMIPPILFMPLLENAFKFCGDEPGSYIYVYLETTTDRILFRLENSMNAERQGPGGLGLKNFKKRLDLYYSGKYIYQVTDDNCQYKVLLTIDLA